MKSTRVRAAIPMLILIGLRIVVALLPGGSLTDQGCFKAWGLGMVQHGPGAFYSASDLLQPCDYPPLYLYGLWAWDALYTHLDPSVSRIRDLDTLMYSTPWLTLWNKLPAMLTDFLNAWLIWKILTSWIEPAKARVAAIAYLLNPVFLYDSGYWGQVDCLTIAGMLGMLWLSSRDRLQLTGALGALSVVLKPQALFLFPSIVFSQWFRRSGQEWVQTLALSLIVASFPLLPFWPGTGVFGAWSHFARLLAYTANEYPASAVNAFNLHTFIGFMTSDSVEWLGLAQRTWGLLLVLLVQGLVGWRLYTRRDPATFTLGASIAVLSFYMLSTRMHERYIIPGLAMLVLAYGLNPRLRVAYWTLTGTTLWSLQYVLDGQFANWFQPFGLYRLAAVANLAAFTWLLREFFRQPPAVDAPDLGTVETEHPVSAPAKVT